ncbi:MAG: VOC family protein [Acidobacteriota bacterium]|jgi:predicted enzyme related to lactoylglutathione lyase|nr:VOC family protein [Acidobacteriota bacterium]
MNLNQVTIHSEKPVETVAFYQKLGLKLIVDSLPRYARLKCPDGDSTLSVNIAENVIPNPNIVLYFECEDLDAKVTELKKLGLEFDEDPADRPWLWRQAYLADPNFNKICLFHAGENRKNPPWRVN